MIHYFYANQSNDSEWFSARGIQSLLARRAVTEHFCDEPLFPKTVAELGKAGPDDFIVIGGVNAAHTGQITGGGSSQPLRKSRVNLSRTKEGRRRNHIVADKIIARLPK
jgi:hypothetical protein